MMNFDQQELQSVPWKVMDFMNQELVKGNTFKKLKVIIIALTWGKVLGHNGLLMEFFLNNFEHTW
jgi:hypothetical protein